MPLCPHNQNPIACLQCFQLKQRAPKGPPPPRTFMGPQIAQGKVVGQEAIASNPQLAALAAKKQAAFEAMANRLPAPLGTTTVGGSVQEVNPHAQARTAPAQRQEGPSKKKGHRHRDPVEVSRHARREEDDPEFDPAWDGSIDSNEMQALEQLYPRRENIIDRQPSHPAAPSGRGGTRALQPVRGKPRSA